MTTAEITGRRRSPVALDAFTVDLNALPHQFWYMLGQTQSKVVHIDDVPLLPAVARELNAVYLVKGAFSTTAIEGNTLTEDEVMRIYRKELTLPPSRRYQEIEVRNMLDYMNERATGPLRGDLNESEIFEMNERIMRDLDTESHVLPGAYRTETVGVGRYRCPPPEDVGKYMHSFVKWYNDFPKSSSHVDEISFAIVKAIVTHVYFVLIHPFGDGNGRTARLLEWRTLDQAKIPQPAAHLLSNHYNLTRSRYYEMLDRASIGGDVNVFLCYAIEGLRDQLATQLVRINKEYADLVYRDIVRRQTPGISRDVQRRRQELALVIERIGPATKAEIIASSSGLAAAYALATPKTYARDLTALAEARLIRSVGNRWEGRTDTMYWSHRREFKKPIRTVKPPVRKQR